MSKAMIILEADRAEWTEAVQVPGGGLRQEVRLYEGAECKVVLQVSFSATSEAARQWEARGAELRAAMGSSINTNSIRSEADLS